MQGHNSIRLNLATIKEAVGEYLNKRLAPSAQLQITTAVWLPGTSRLEVDVEPATKGKTP